MKSLVILLTFIICLSILHSQTVTNINAFYRDGQVFVTWENLTVSNVLYTLYHSSNPIEYGYQLSSARNLGSVRDNSAKNERLSDILGILKYLKIDSARVPLSGIQGLFVATSTDIGSFYYAVTTTINNVEDTAIILGVNSISSPISETVVMPRPV